MVTNIYGSFDRMVTPQVGVADIHRRGSPYLQSDGRTLWPYFVHRAAAAEPRRTMYETKTQFHQDKWKYQSEVMY